MSRLTKKYKGGYGLVKVKDNEQAVDSEYPNTLKAIIECFNTLGEIEDILCPGDAPEISLDELREMCKAKRENQYTIPFKIGDRIWRLVNDANPHLTRDKIFKIEFRGDGDFVELIGGRIAKLSEFDKSLFISSEAAEAALKDGENK